MESSTSWSLSAGVELRRNCGRSGCRGRGGPSPSGRGTREAPGEGRRSSQILRPSPCPLPEGEGGFSANVQLSSAEPSGVVDLSVAAVEINSSGFLIAAAFGEGHPAADEPSSGECHRSEVSPIPQLPKAHCKDRAVRKCFDRDTRAGQLLCRACFHAPNHRLAVCVELRLAVRTQQLKQKLGMIGSQDKTRELSCHRQRFRLIVHGE